MSTTESAGPYMCAEECGEVVDYAGDVCGYCWEEARFIDSVESDHLEPF